MLSAANTLDIDESKWAKKRKLSAANANSLKKNLLLNKMRPPPIITGREPELAHSGNTNHLFSVGGYPPGLDPSTLPPARTCFKTDSKLAAKAAKTIDSESVEQARQASQLAKQALERPRVGKRLLLSMALVRTNPRTPPSCYPAHGTVLTDRFHWASFPPLDTILRKNMKRYYELSTEKCQSKDQQEFNNDLVLSVKREAHKYGWEFDHNAFDDKKVRDRIRCFYKTHIQNAKKRLKTMLRHPEKRANIKALAAHFHLIEEKGAEISEHTTASDDYDSDADDDDDNDGEKGYEEEEEQQDFDPGQSYSADGQQQHYNYHSGGESAYATRGSGHDQHEQ